jgi:hypothetical protein
VAVLIIVVDMATPLGTEATRCCLLTPQRTTVAGCDSELELLSRSAVINLTVANTGGPGFVAVFAGGIAYPGNSSINFTGANQVVANGVISATNSAGQITIRGGASPAHVIIDRIGFMV